MSRKTNVLRSEIQYTDRLRYRTRHQHVRVQDMFDYPYSNIGALSDLRVWCPECDAYVPVLRSGKVAKHRWYWFYRCPGSGFAWLDAYKTEWLHRDSAQYEARLRSRLRKNELLHMREMWLRGDR